MRIHIQLLFVGHRDTVMILIYSPIEIVERPGRPGVLVDTDQGFGLEGLLHTIGANGCFDGCEP